MNTITAEIKNFLIMKHIGIVVVTTVGACICANEIVAEAAKQNFQGEHPEYSMHSISFSYYKELLLKKDWNGMADLILRSIEKLKISGAEFIIIPSNTPHYAFTRIQEKSPLPVLNLIEITSNMCHQNGFKKVAVLGTKATMQGGLYDSYLQQKGITPIIPNDEGCNAIHDLIMNEIIPLKNTRTEVASFIAEKVLHSLDCDAYILGCTELPDVYTEKNLGKPVIDTTRLLAREALRYAMLQNHQEKKPISAYLNKNVN